jgi:hypothetical protein
MKLMHRHACLAAASAALFVPAAALGAAPPRVDSTYTDAAGVVHYAFDPSALRGATVVAQQGAATTAGGCRFSAEGSGGPHAGGPVVTKLTELTFDARACTRRLASATYPIATAPAALKAQLAATPDSSASASEAGGGVGAAVTNYIGLLKLSVELPSQIDVSSTQARVNWSGSPSCVSSSSHSANWGWYTAGGWSRTGYSWSYGRNCSRAYTNTYGKFKSSSWCWPSTTTTEHKKTWFEGRPGGRWYWSYEADKSGTCSGMLHYDYLLTTP